MAKDAVTGSEQGPTTPPQPPVAPQSAPARPAAEVPVAREPEVAAGRGARAPARSDAVEAEEDALCALLADAYVRTDAYGVIRKANAAASELLGRPTTWLTGKPLAAFVDEVHRQELRRLVDALREASGPRTLALHLRPADGEPVAVTVVVAPVHQDGEVVGARWIVRRAADAPAGEAAIGAPVPAVAATTAYYNEFLARVTGGLGELLDPRELLRVVARQAVPALGDWCLVDLLGADGALERVAVAHTPIEHAADAAALAAAPARGASDPATRAARTARPQLERFGEGTALPVPGAPGPQAWLAVPLVARGTVLGVVSFLMVRSHRPFAPLGISAAEELARRVALSVDNATLYRQAVAASAAKSAFLGTISHELRTPLTAVIGYAELLGDGLVGPLDARQADFVRRIRDSGDHLLHLVEEVLGFARLEAHEEHAACEPVDVAAMVRQVLAVVEPQARAKGLALEGDVVSGDGLVLHTDPTKLRQILVNLVGNAVKFTDRGEVAVRVARDARRDCVTFDVCDTGIGIPPELLPHVFDAFWQVEQTSTRARGGAGLGLSVVRHLAHLLGGDVSVTSELGVGSRFHVWLPSGAARRAGPD